MIVVKRDGRRVEFDSSKIVKAILKAYEEVDGRLTPDARKKAAEIAQYISSLQTKLLVEEIQDIIEDKLMASRRKDVAKAYIIYRNERTKTRDQKSKIVLDTYKRVYSTIDERSNANVDEGSFSGREKEAASAMSKTIAFELDGINKESADAHKNMLIYEHDAEKIIWGVHNCLFADIPKLLKDGFTTRNGDVRGANSFATACQLVAVIFQCQSQVMYGGVGSMHIDYDLAPYVKKSFLKYYLDGLIEKCNKPKDIAKVTISVAEEFNIHIDDSYFKMDKAAYDYAMKFLLRECKQSAQGLYHNLNTLESRAGSQVPFTSINFGRDTSPEGRLVTQSLLEASIDGIGRYHRTPIFPISIFQHKKGVNADKGDPNYDLKLLALKSLSKRIYPNFVNCDFSEAHEDKGDIDTIFATMGCRTMLGYDRHGFGYRRQGRGNISPCTIILPKLGIENGICLGERMEPDLGSFWKSLKSSLQVCENMLLERFEIIKRQRPSSAPFMYNNGTMHGLTDEDTEVYNAIKHGTLAIGIIGVAEMCTALFGQNHAENKVVWNFAYEVVEYINTFVKEASERNDLNFSTYFTPAEGLCHTAAKALREQFGEIKNVTDREYLTNSVHVPVWMKMSIFEKLNVEAPFCKFGTGGCITYCETDSTFMENIKAVESIVNYAMSLDIPYLAINFPIDTCLECGYQGEINSKCPMCNGNHIEHLARVTGYLSTDVSHFNNGKQAEVADRQKHSSYTDFGVMP